ncbi:hypothetical protein ACT3RL_17995 [Halomonas sp. AOP5-CZ2-32]
MMAMNPARLTIAILSVFWRINRSHLNLNFLPQNYCDLLYLFGAFYRIVNMAKFFFVIAGAILMTGCTAQSHSSNSDQLSGYTSRTSGPADNFNSIPEGIFCDEVTIIGRPMAQVSVLDEEVLARNEPLLDDGKISCKLSQNLVTNKYELWRSESGIYEGLRYRIQYRDGSGTFQGDYESTLGTQDILRRVQNWSVRCRVDRIDDTRRCFLNKEGLTVGIWKDATPYISIGSSHYPGSSITVRADKNQPVVASERSGFSPAQSQNILNQLKVSSSLITRYQEWPYESNVDKSIDLYGFNEAWDFLQIVYNSINVN